MPKAPPVAAIALVLASGALSSQGETFGAFYAFGDSLTDCCVSGRSTEAAAPAWARPLPFMVRRHLQKKTPNWSDLLPPLIGADYAPGPNTNLAIGGAQSGRGDANPSLREKFGAETGFLAQIDRFEALETAVGPEDVAGVWIGVNDIHPSLRSEGGSQPLGPRPEADALAEHVASNVSTGLRRLRALGFRRVVLLSPYDVADTAFAADADAKALATRYSTAIRDRLAALRIPGLRIYFVDVLSLLDAVQADPKAFGFEHATTEHACEDADCDRLGPREQSAFVFVDGVHLTSAFHALVAAEAAAAVARRERAAPSSGDGAGRR